jgi:CubicO group peptidase (beta-lactamase class C family)
LPWRADFTWTQRLAGIDLGAVDPQAIPLLSLGGAEGDAGVFSTVDDMYRWSRLTQGSALVSPALAKEIFTGNDGYGMGWVIGEQYGEQRWRHTGELPGYLSNVEIFPQQHITIVMMDNFDLNMRATTNALGLIALGKPYDMPVAGKLLTLTAAQIQPLLGAYRFADGRTLCVGHDPQFVTASVKGQFTAGLLALSPTRFYMPLSDGTAQFTLNGSSASAVNLRYDAVDHVATRVAPACSS